MRHHDDCAECPGMLKIAEVILTEGYVTLSCAFKSAFPHITYHTLSAKRKLLRMPIAALRVGNAASGTSCVYLFEFSKNILYEQFLHLLNDFHCKATLKNVTLTKSDMRDLLCLATSNRKSELLKYTIWKASGLSATGVRKVYGMQQMIERGDRVQQCIQEAKEIREEIEELCNDQEEAWLATHDAYLYSSSSDDEMLDDVDEPSVNVELQVPSHNPHVEVTPPELVSVGSSQVFDQQLVTLAADCMYNWFEIISRLEAMTVPLVDTEVLETQYQSLLEKLNLSEQEKLIQSHDAFLYIKKNEEPLREREAQVCNGEIVTESDSDNPDE